MNKYIITTLLSCFFIVFGFCQEDIEKAMIPNIYPVSPNAASLGKYGTYPVNKNNGIPNISIPLYTIKQGDLEVPISLSYHASGIKVNEIASSVGLGWTLNAGGAIVHNIKGIEDFKERNDNSLYKEQGRLPNLENATFNQLYFQYMYGVSLGYSDTGFDEHIYNFNGYSGKFFLDNEEEIVITNRDPLKIEYSPYKKLNNSVDFQKSSTKITDSKGNQYYFGITSRGENINEITDILNDESKLNQNTKDPFVSSSPLTEIISSDRKDTIRFTYNDNEYQPDVDNIGEIYYSRGDVEYLKESITTPYSKIKEKVLSEIHFGKGKVKFINEFDRLDSGSSKLKEIQVLNNSNKIIERIKINTNYFDREGGVNSIFPRQDKTIPHNYTSRYDNKKSLKLESIEIGINAQPKKYQFEYNSKKLPIRTTNKQDYWGYANDYSGKGFLDKQELLLATWEGLAVIKQKFYKGEGSRESNEDFMKAAVLEKIIYPTGGYTFFDFEANKYESVLTDYQKFSKSIYAYGFYTNGDSPGINAGRRVEESFEIPNYEKAVNVKLDIGFSNAINGNPSPANSYISTEGFGTIIGTEGCNNIKQVRGPHEGDRWPSRNYIFNNLKVCQSNLKLVAQEYGVGSDGAGGNPFVSGRVSWEIPIERKEILSMGGLRIKTIKNYDYNNRLLTTKRFNYLKYNVLFPKKQSYLLYVGHQEYYNKISTTPLVPLGLDVSAPIEYIEIEEFDLDRSNNSKGKLVSYYVPTQLDTNYPQDHFKSIGNCGFYHHLGDFYCGGPDWIDHKVFNWDKGHLKREEQYKLNKSKQYILSSKIDNEYIELNLKKYHSNNILTVMPLHSSGITPGADGCGHENPWGTCSQKQGRHVYSMSHFTVGKIALSKTKETLYDDNGENPIITEKEYKYDHPNHFLTETKIKTSDDKEKVEKIFYPDKVDQLSGYTLEEKNTIKKMILLHQIGIPIQKEQYKDLIKLSQTRTLFKEIKENVILPKAIQQAKGLGTLETKLTYDKYDTKGNVLQYHTEDGLYTSIIWGYNGQYPVAKVEGAIYDEISSYANNIGSLRAGVPKAMVTTYTYEPLVGVTSITDPNGQVQRFEYDEFNRLKRIKDHTGKVLKAYDYQYKTQE
ncbi:hypothetical protein UJ101_01906 [Flavobacteriaceae bacterium UJ101]|nr:hypothetical protein UJ101_01906 [Flavobacteriaceae bacterium UJ101]